MAKKYTYISFESNGGTDVEDITKEFNALVNEPGKLGTKRKL